jgi:hypothetical protein
MSSVSPAKQSRSDRVSFWRQLVAQRESASLTVREVCQQAGVSPVSYYHWQRKLRTPPPSAKEATPALLPVRVVDDRRGELTLELPHGLRLRFAADCAEATLQKLLRATLSACRESASC